MLNFLALLTILTIFLVVITIYSIYDGIKVHKSNEMHRQRNEARAAQRIAAWRGQHTCIPTNYNR